MTYVVCLGPIVELGTLLVDDAGSAVAVLGCGTIDETGALPVSCHTELEDITCPADPLASEVFSVGAPVSALDWGVSVVLVVWIT